MEAFDAFLVRLLKEPGLQQRYHTYLTIHVTEFFRDAEYWTRLKSELTAANKTMIRAWSAGCSTGAEPVSLGILLSSMAIGYSILATDSDATILAVARQGQYSTEMIAGVPSALKSQVFAPVSENLWQVKPHIAERIQFRQHNLLKDPFPSGLDLIACRNVLIYFENEPRGNVLQSMADALVPGGYLFIGSMETILNYSHHGLIRVAPSLYKKV